MSNIHYLQGAGGSGNNTSNQPPGPTDMELAERVARIETRLESFATKEDLHRELNSQTWKLVTFVTGFGTILTAAVYFIAKHIG